jgi:hypothetical protein
MKKWFRQHPIFLWSGFGLLLFLSLWLVLWAKGFPPADLFPKNNAHSAGEENEPGSLEEDVLGEQQVVFQHFYRFCPHHTLNNGGDWPEELKYLQNVNLSLFREAQLPKDWQLVHFTEDLVIFTFLGDLCPGCREQRYLGVYEGKIAVFYGEPPGGLLDEVLPFEVKDVYRAELENGIAFHSEEEKEMLLENFTT